MKSIVLSLLLLGITFGLAACNKGGGGSSASTPSCQGYYFNGSYYVDGSGRQVNCADTTGRMYGQGYGMNNCINYTYNNVNRNFMNPAGRPIQCQGGQYYDYVNFMPYYTNQGNGCFTEGFYPASFGGRIVCTYTTVFETYGIDPYSYPNGTIFNAGCRGGAIFGVIPWTFCGPGMGSNVY